MINTNSLGILGQFYFNIKEIVLNQFIKIQIFTKKKYQKLLIIVLNINQVLIYFHL